MGWWGAIIGGVLGWVIAGPWGAFFGALIGLAFASRSVRIHVVGGNPAHTQQVFFRTTFQVMGHIAKADGRVSENEIRAARAVMAQMNLSAEQQRAAMEYFDQGKQPEFPLDAALTEFRQACGGYPGLVSMFLQIQMAAALADGVMHPAEQAVFNRICALLGIPPIVLRQYEGFARARSGYGGGAATQPRVDHLAAAYETLGVSASASDEEVKRAYRRLMKENHPDRLVSKGLPPEMLAMAQEKAKQINLAYEAVKTARGMK
ncbi:MAG: co-chaperone DjlA [Gammaproteobacteria bacterium]|nr:co-chaperone DjlA [Gammaproteobacteria bacterium]